MAARPGQLRTKHPEIAEQARQEPGEWFPAAVYRSLPSAQAAARRIPRADRMTAYEPAGTFEAYSARHDDGGAVWVRYVAGLPKPKPRPTTMTYRVCDRGEGPGYTGVGIVTVVVAAECPRCGGPRGEAVPHRFHEDGDWYVVDTWKNRCGHEDLYAQVLAEYREQLQVIQDAERRTAAMSAAARAIGARPPGPVEAGEYTAAVVLLDACAGEHPGLHAKQGARFLDMRGQAEAARRVEEERISRGGRMSARQAAAFLIELAAARKACTRCEDGLVNYQGGDGEFVSLRCDVCRRDVAPRA